MDEEWFTEPYAEYWNIVTGHGEVVAEYLRSEAMAEYIIAKHHRDLRERHGFQKSLYLSVLPERTNPNAKQCSAICPPYRCVLEHNHTGVHYTYGIDTVYKFDTSV